MENGASLRANLEQVERTTGIQPDGLENPSELPERFEHVWEWFSELNSARGMGFNSLAPITFQDIDAWRRLTESEPNPAEVKLIRRLDSIYLKVINAK